MCMAPSMKTPPPPQQTAPQVAPPSQAPDSGLGGIDMSNAIRRRAMASAGMNQNIATSPLGAVGQAVTTKTQSAINNLLG